MKKTCGTCLHGDVSGFRGPCAGCRGALTNYSKWVSKSKSTHTTVRCYGDFLPGSVYEKRDCGTCIHLVACKDETTAKAIKASIAPAKAGSITAPSLLNKAASIMDERGRQYDSEGGERSMGRCVVAFNAITGRDLTEPEGWLLLQVLKDVRQWQKPG